MLLENGTRREFGSLLIATGADPVRLPIPGHDTAKVHYLRSFADSRAIVDLARNAKHAVVVGVPGIFAAGDVARWPDPHTGERIRVEHFVVAERQGQVAARNMLGQRDPFDAVPFFWSQHYDVTIRYVGHAERWDSVKIDGSLDRRAATVAFILGGTKRAVATVSRDRACLEAELALEHSTVPVRKR